MAVCPAGPPKLIKPSLSQYRQACQKPIAGAVSGAVWSTSLSNKPIGNQTGRFPTLQAAHNHDKMIHIAVYLPAFLLKAMKRVLFLFVCSWVNLLISGVTLAETSDNPPETYRATLDKNGIQRVQILGGDYFFKPKHIIVKARVPVQLSVRVEPGIKPHDIVIKAPQAGIRVNQKLATAPKTTSFIPLVPGKYPFYCSSKLLFFESHRERGMEGVLEVTE